MIDSEADRTNAEIAKLYCHRKDFSYYSTCKKQIAHEEDIPATSGRRRLSFTTQTPDQKVIKALVNQDISIQNSFAPVGNLHSIPYRNQDAPRASTSPPIYFQPTNDWSSTLNILKIKVPQLYTKRTGSFICNFLPKMISDTSSFRQQKDLNFKNYMLKQENPFKIVIRGQ
ncbi:hypothetical protein CEXT_302131 [Caerostris extrusa]|uniref:Uncharacterized protein n=1 Tax=Caerostris extrusa TaxID=172846 RepID=A0AAV4PBN8_CAEEX|nr:hypothetical protein CEXT_302131 [Caerostris extrusa]